MHHPPPQTLNALNLEPPKPQALNIWTYAEPGEAECECRSPRDESLWVVL